jgi:hypothetical protein
MKPSTRRALVVIGVTFLAGTAIACGGLIAAASAGLAALWRSPVVREGTLVVQATIDLLTDASTAPGTAELRDAGCERAFAITPEHYQRFAARLPQGTWDIPLETTVACAVRAPARVACDDLAVRYARAVGGRSTEIVVRAASLGPDGRCEGVICEGVYATDGRFVRPLGPRDLRGPDPLSR